ncbi:hypothetical protein A6U97_12140 [Agrobacterium tumefaciens]|uniref:hypothetical protein n=1 Tax=Agrobacterium tumefaciens TaxID=358 RepID=UPI00080FB971|nr:hypothetical protein A6U97_12140 [Agrobacterium tumefaciens]
MPDFQKKRVYILAVLVFGAAIILPVIFGLPRGISGQAGDGWRNFIYDFQTLVTGILAIAAAWWNVTAMRAADKENDRRHKETLQNARFDEVRTIERALNPQVAQIRSALEMIQVQKKQMLMINTLEGQLERVAKHALFMSHFVRTLEEALSRPQIQDGMRFFDGTLTYEIGSLRNRVADAMKAMTIIMERPFYRTSFVEKADMAVSDLYRFYVRAEDDIGPVLEALKGVAAKYQVNVVGLDHE